MEQTMYHKTCSVAPLCDTMPRQEYVPLQKDSHPYGIFDGWREGSGQERMLLCGKDHANTRRWTVSP